MSGHRRRGSWGSIFSLDGLRSLSRAATPSTLQRSTTEPSFGVPYHKHKIAPQATQKETKAALEETEQQTKSAPSSLRLRIRDASAKASAKLKRLRLKKPTKNLEKLPKDMRQKMPEKQCASSSDYFTTKPHEQDCEDVTDLEATKSTPDIQHPLNNPLRCHPDVMAMTESPVMPVVGLPAVPPIIVNQESEQDDNESDSYRADLPNALVYSKSMNKIQNYGRQTTSPPPIRRLHTSPTNAVQPSHAH